MAKSSILRSGGGRLRTGEQSSDGIGRPGPAEAFNILPRSSAPLAPAAADSAAAGSSSPRAATTTIISLPLTGRASTEAEHAVQLQDGVKLSFVKRFFSLLFHGGNDLNDRFAFQALTQDVEIHTIGRRLLPGLDALGFYQKGLVFQQINLIFDLKDGLLGILGVADKIDQR